MRLLVQARQTVCYGSGRLLVAFVLSTYLEAFVPRLRSASANQQQYGKGNLQAHELPWIYGNATDATGCGIDFPTFLKQFQ